MKSKSFKRFMDNIFNVSEDVLYIIVGALLILCAAFLTFHTVKTAFQYPEQENFIWWIIKLLDKILLMLMLLEILFTVRVSFAEHSLCAEPFLIVALIAAVRRILVLSVETAYFPEHFQEHMIEIGILGILILIFVISITLMRNKTQIQNEASLTRKEI